MYYLFKANMKINQASFELVLNSVLEEEIYVELFDEDSGYLESGISISSKLRQLLPLIEADYGDTLKFLSTPYLNDLSKYCFKYLNELSANYYSLADAVLVLAMKGHQLRPYLETTFENVPKDLMHNIEEFIKQGSNVVETAKLQYIHRNTMNQRIAKFIDLTSLDLRDYEHCSLIHVYNLLSENE